MGAIASQITSLTIVYSTVYSDADQRKHQSSASLAFVRGIPRGEFPAQMASNVENVSIWWRHLEIDLITPSLTSSHCVIFIDYQIILGGGGDYFEFDISIPHTPYKPDSWNREDIDSWNHEW